MSLSGEWGRECLEETGSGLETMANVTDVYQRRTDRNGEQLQERAAWLWITRKEQGCLTPVGSGPAGWPYPHQVTSLTHTRGTAALLCPYLLWKEAPGPRAGDRYSELHSSRSIKCRWKRSLWELGRHVAWGHVIPWEAAESSRDFRLCWAQGLLVPVELVSPPFSYSDFRLSIAFLDLRLLRRAWAGWETGTQPLRAQQSIWCLAKGRGGCYSSTAPGNYFGGHGKGKKQQLWSK